MNAQHPGRKDRGTESAWTAEGQQYQLTATTTADDMPDFDDVLAAVFAPEPLDAIAREAVARAVTRRVARGIERHLPPDVWPLLLRQLADDVEEARRPARPAAVRVAA